MKCKECDLVKDEGLGICNYHQGVYAERIRVVKIIKSFMRHVKRRKAVTKYGFELLIERVEYEM